MIHLKSSQLKVSIYAGGKFHEFVKVYSRLVIRTSSTTEKPSFSFNELKNLKRDLPNGSIRMSWNREIRQKCPFKIWSSTKLCTVLYILKNRLSRVQLLKYRVSFQFFIGILVYLRTINL